jgi:ribonuclease PH
MTTYRVTISSGQQSDYETIEDAWEAAWELAKAQCRAYDLDIDVAEFDNGVEMAAGDDGAYWPHIEIVR